MAGSQSQENGSIDLQHALGVATDAAHQAGELIVKAFNAPKNVELKGKVDLVSSSWPVYLSPAKCTQCNRQLLLCQA